MISYEIKQGLDLGAGAFASAGVVVNMVRENYYHVEAFAPIHLPALRQTFRSLHLPWKNKAANFEKWAARRDGELFVPITAVIRSFRKLPADLEEFLFQGKLWQDDFANLVVQVGLNDSLDKHLKGSSYTAAWYVGLTGATPTFALADTSSSHAGWTEVTAYSESVRQTWTLGTVASGSVDNSASKAIFTINANGTALGGAFVIANSTKGGTTGVLYGGGAFSTGNKTLSSADVLQVTITATAT